MADLKIGYAINQWDTIRRDSQERALKTIAVCGFRAIELTSGTGRWAPLGRPELLDVNFGSTHALMDFLKSCGIDHVVSWFYDPGANSIEEGSPGRTPSNPAHHDGIVQSLAPFARRLRELGGSVLVARPMASYWREAPITDDKIKVAADCWNKVGRMTQAEGIATTLHPDFLGALHSDRDIATMLRFTDPSLVGLTIDTAEFAIAGIDPVAFYNEHSDRVRHFHFKDAHDRDTLGEYKERAAEAFLLDGGGKRAIERWFWEMGTRGGLVDFPALVRAMTRHRYQGWVIVESDRGPSAVESAMLNSWYVQKVIAPL